MTERCKKIVYSRMFHTHTCPWKVWKDGYCKRHHPDNVVAKRQARSAELDAEWSERSKRIAKQAAISIAEREVIEAALSGYKLKDAVDALRKAREM